LLSGIFAVMALLLTTVGVAGLIARGVATRLRELCIRMAVGATPSRAFMLAVSRGFGAVVTGMTAGLVATRFTSYWLSAYLYEVRAGDALTVFATAAATIVVCLGATVLATRRLRRIDLAAVLRE
jgi:ABC-type antimicrobial peptide transport system permease subunit